MQEGNKFKILLIDQADFIGGAELFNLDLINHLDLNHFEVHLLSSRNRDYQSKIKVKIKTHYSQLPRLKGGIGKIFVLFQSAWQLQKLIKKEQFDLIQTNTIRGHILTSFAKKFFRLPTKLIWFVHDFTFPGNILRYLIKIPDKIFTCSEIVKKDLITKTDIMFSEKIKVIYNGIDFTEVEKSVKEVGVVKEKQDVKILDKLERYSCVGIVGRLDPWKGQDLFLRAAREVHQFLPEVKFVVIGSASSYDAKTVQFEKELKQLSDDLGLNNIVDFQGYINDLDQAMGELTILVHASKHPEPFGRVIIEAMSLGKVVIASALGGACEIIQEGENGFLVQPEDYGLLAQKIIEVLKNPELQKIIGENAQKHVQHNFNLVDKIKEIERCWEQCLTC